MGIDPNARSTPSKQWSPAPRSPPDQGLGSASCWSPYNRSTSMILRQLGRQGSPDCSDLRRQRCQRRPAQTNISINVPIASDAARDGDRRSALGFGHAQFVGHAVRHREFVSVALLDRPGDGRRALEPQLRHCSLPRPGRCLHRERFGSLRRRLLVSFHASLSFWLSWCSQLRCLVAS